MKLNRSFLIVLLIGITVSAQAQDPSPLPVDSTGLTIQQVVSQMYTNAPVNDSSEGGLRKRIQFFETFWKDRATSNVSSEPNMFARYYKGLRDDIIHRQTNSCSYTGFKGNWKVLGPLTLPQQRMGYVNCVWAWQNPQNDDDTSFILAGTWGGLFKSSDGGVNWECITDKTPITGGVAYVSSIAVNPLNKNTIYLGTASSSGLTSIPVPTSLPYVGGPNGVAILKSFDGGQNWEQEVIPISNDWGDSVRMIQRVYFTPDSTRIYAFYGDRVFTRSNVGTPTWQEITPPNVSTASNFFDLEFVPGDQDHFFVSNGTKSNVCQASIWESTVPVPTTNDWTRITTNLSGTVLDNHFPTVSVTPGGNNWLMFDMSIPNANTLFVLAMAEDNATYPTHNPFYSLYSYNITGSPNIWTNINNSIPYSNTGVNHTVLALEVSPANTDNVYIGTDLPYQSTDGGQTFDDIGTYGGVPTHADIRDFFLHKSTTSTNGVEDRLYIATDGGVSLKPSGRDVAINEHLTSIDISGTGLACGHFWSAATSEESGLILGGSMHDGIHAYEPAQATKWIPLRNADAYTTMFDMTDRTIGYALWGFGGYERDITQPASGRVIGNANSSNNYPSEDKILAPPMKADNTNQHYTGLINLYRQTAPTTNWQTMASIPINGLPDINDNQKIKDITFDPGNTNYHGYVLYGDQREIYYRDPSATNTDFSDLKDLPAVAHYPITCIVADPGNVERAWFGMGDVHYGNTAPVTSRVYYTPDAGSTWLDISDGLPLHIPVSELVYYEVGDILFCATDVGIYKCDMSTFDANSNYSTSTTSNGIVHGRNNSVEWVCFNDGDGSGPDFPNAYVTDLNINYCSGQLIAATYGRSIWASDIFENTYIPKDEIEITTNTTWNDTRYMHGSIRIKSGATLTISGSGTTIFMPKNGLIVVEPNAKLIVNDATITNGCEECLWGGIRLEGDKTQVQSPLYQGSVELDGATIENAIVAIGNYDADKSINSSGGIIQAISTTFLNNEKAIDLTYYHKQTSTFVKNYKAFFNLCTFDIDDNYKFDNGNGYTGSNPHRFFSHVSLYEVDGVIFNGCEFKNSNTGQYEGWGEGIFSTNAGFQVRAYCNSVTPTIPCDPGDLVKSSFTGFKHGIWIEHDNLLNNFAVKVDQATFDYCSIGIRMNNQYLSHLTRNEFTIGNGKEIDIDAFDCHKNIGIFATSTSAPTIEDNIMNGVTHGGQHPDHENIGIIIEDTRGSDIQIYHNTLQDLHKGCLALGSNDRPYYYINASTGVQFLCNSFSNNEDDIYVSAEPDGNGNHLRGIADYQGSAQKDAGNTFQGTTNTHITNIGAPFTYYYDGIGGTNQPTLLNAASVINVVASSGQNSCPSNFDPSGGGTGWNTPLSSGSLTGVKANFFIHQTDRNDAVSTLEGFIDLGNTPDFINFINNCMVVDTPILRDTLLTITPYVSEDALRATADKNILDKTVFIDILKVNPDVLRNEEFLYYLGNSIPAPLSPGEIDILRTAAASSTARTDMEAEITDHNLLMSIHANEVIAHYLLDTTDVDKDSIPVWYDHQNNLQAEYAKAAFYTGTGDYSSASSVLNNIPTKFSLTSQQNDDHNAYKDTWNLLKSILDDDRTVLQMTSGEQTDLSDISSSGIGANSLISYTVGVITDQVGPNYRLACAEILLSEGKPGGQTNISKTKTSQELLKVYPNPAKDNVTFEYNLSETANINIVVAGITGQVVYQTELANNSGKISWNTNSIAAGVYTYKLVKDGQALQVGKLVITK